MTTTTETSFSDSIHTRIISGVLALILAVIIASVYKDDIVRLVSSGSENGLPASSASVPVATSNPELAACLEKRIGDVDEMKENGVLSEAQYASFRSRAEELCIQQNPAQN